MLLTASEFKRKSVVGKDLLKDSIRPIECLLQIPD